MESNQQAIAWKELINLLPIILPEKKNKAFVKANFETIKAACNEQDLQIGTMFNRLKHAASTVAREFKREKFAKTGHIRQAYGIGYSQPDASSDESSDEEQDGDYIRGVDISSFEEALEESNTVSDWPIKNLSKNPNAQSLFNKFVDQFNEHVEEEEEPEEPLNDENLPLHQEQPTDLIRVRFLVKFY
jgi:hypothetical protein